MAGVVTMTQNFPNAGGGILDTFASMLPINLGIPLSALNGVNGKYVVSVTSRYDSAGMVASTAARQPVTIFAYLQEKIGMSVGSHWNNVGFSPGSIAEALAGITFGRSTRSTVTSRRTWGGSDPVSISLKLRFEAYTDITQDVVQPVARLQAMALPREGNTGGFFLIPPGPNPYKYTIGGKTQLGGGDQITVKVGDFLTFSSVVIEEVAVEWDSKFGETGPTSAGVMLKFTTYEMLTQQKLQALYGSGIQLTGTDIPKPAKQVPLMQQALGNAIGVSAPFA